MECSNVCSIVSDSHLGKADIQSSNTLIEQLDIEIRDMALTGLVEKVGSVFQAANGTPKSYGPINFFEDHFEVFPRIGNEVKVVDRLGRKPDEKELSDHPSKDPYLPCRPSFEKTSDFKIYFSINGLQEDYLPFHFAILEPNLYLYSALRSFLRYKGDGDINQIDADGNNALHVACMSIKLDLIFDLIDSGCNPAQRNGFGDSPMDILARNKGVGDKEFIFILKKLPDINVASTVLHNTLSTTIADYLLERHISIDTLNANGYTPLIAAIKNSTRQTKSGGACYHYIEHLCKKNANLELGLPFHQTIKKHDNLDFFQLLIEYGGNPNQVDINGDNALMLACEVIPLYQQNETKWEEESDDDNFSFFFNKYQIFIKDLLEFGCDYITPNKFGIFPLVVIANNRFITDAMIHILLKQDIITFMTTDSSYIEKTSEELKIFLTPLLPIMYITQNEEIISLFLNAGFSIDSFDENGRSLLFSAIKGVDILLAEYLIDKGADPTLVNPNNNTKNAQNLKHCGPMSPLALLGEMIAIQGANVMIDKTLCDIGENSNVQPCTIYNDPLSNQLYSEMTQLISKIDRTKFQGSALSTFHLLLTLKDILSFDGPHLEL
jgi:ankyrin repeat protein